MRKILVLGLLLLGRSLGFAQTLTVLDLETNHPVEGARIEAAGTGRFVLSGAHGQADIAVLGRPDSVFIGRVGYEMRTYRWAELQSAGFTAYLTPIAFSLDREAVVSGFRWQQRRRETPARIARITGRDVALQNPQTAADLLGTSGEVFIQKSQQGGGSPMLRGFATNRVLLVVDGVRMNTAIFRSGNVQNVISLDPFALEQTEVLFGPGSVAYGSDAIGGVMYFQTRAPQLSDGEGVRVQGQAVGRMASANSERTTHFHVGVGGQKWAMLSSASFHHFGDLRMGTRGPAKNYVRPFYVQRIDGRDVVVMNEDSLVQRPSGYEQINFMQKVRFRPNERWDVQYGLHYSTTTNYARYDRLLRVRPNGLPNSAEWNYGPQVWNMHQLNVAHARSTALFDEVVLRAAYQFFEESRIDRNFNAAVRRSRVEKVDAYSVNADLAKRWGDRHALYYGAEAVFNRVRSTGTDQNVNTNVTVPGPSRYPQAEWTSWAAFAHYEYRPSARWLLQAGARYNLYGIDARFDTAFYPFPFTTATLNQGAPTGSVGVIWMPTDRWTLSARAATGFRSPNVDDMGKVFDSQPGAVVVPNPDLRAEYAYNGEVALARQFGQRVRVQINGYYTLLQDALVRRPFTLNGEDSIVYAGQLSRVLAIQNAAKATVYGLQADVEVRLPAGFGFATKFNYQKGEEELDDGSTAPLRHAAPWFGLSRLTYNTGALGLDFYVVYNGEVPHSAMPTEEIDKAYQYAVDANGKPYAPGWYTLNFKAIYRLNNLWTLSAGVENLTDQRYRPYSSGLVAPGRNAILALRANF
ncbi:MAG: TonB-dependent receptor [Saprospiraceae bacterium]|nr:TonB-dependent receptor [Saprospiraceae bacterium]MDW8229602.1 TonB-dependent receptor [Saprospiraceae bacterium]